MHFKIHSTTIKIGNMHSYIPVLETIEVTSTI